MLKPRHLTLGQGKAEYVIIVALVAISGITAFSYFGGGQRSQVAAITQELAGQESGDMLDLAASYGRRASDAASRDVDLGNFYAGGGSSGGGSGTGGSGGGGIGGGIGGGWTPPGGGGGGWTPPGGGTFPPPGGGGGGMCPASLMTTALTSKSCDVLPPEPCDDSITEIPLEVLGQIFNSDSIPATRIEAISNELTAALQHESISSLIDTKQKMAHFLSQMKQEVGPSMRLTENLNYSVEALKSTFKYFRDNPDEAELYGRKSGQAADQEAIANRVYANRIGNGDVASGDGWRYKGLGVIQLTGKANYETFNTQHNEIWDDDQQDFLATPTMVAEEKYAVRSALVFWKTNNLEAIAAQGVTCTEADAITRVINRYTSSYAERCANLADIMDMPFFKECSKE